MDSKAKLGRVLLNKLNPHIKWDLLEAHPLFNEAEAVVRLADGWFESSVLKAFDVAQRSRMTADELQPDETRLILAITYLMERVGEDRIAEAIDANVELAF